MRKDQKVMGKLEGLAHIGVYVADVEKSKEFYESVLDFKTVSWCVLDEPGGATKVAFVKNGSLTLELIQNPTPQNRSDGVVDHIAMAVEDIEAVRDILESRGVEFETKDVVIEPRMFLNGAKWLLFRGPDNEYLEIIEAM